LSQPEITAELLDEYCERLRNWGKWGPEDELGTLNYITAEKIKQAAGLVKQGRVISLALPYDSNGPQYGLRGRVNPLHLMLATGTDHVLDRQLKRPLGFGYADDTLYLPLQSGTQWDGLGHIFRGGKMWNGYSAEEVSNMGAQKAGVQVMKNRVVSRGVLLDVARAKGVDSLQDGEPIYPDDLDAAADFGKLTVEPGDLVLLRTGQMGRCLREQNWGTYAAGDAPGLSLLCAPWLHAKRIAGIASDTWGVEVRPNEIKPDSYQPLHMVMIPHMGLLVGEIFFLEDVADDCAADGIYEFMFVASPLPITGAVGAPANPQAIK
jgi:kynurenine formamidase